MLSIKDEATDEIKLEKFRARWQSWRIVGKLFPPERERKRERELSTMPQIYRRNAQVSIAVILVVPPSQKIAPQIRLSFHTRISTPICHACIEATYLYTSLRIVIMERTAPPPKLHHSRKWSISRKVSSFRRGISHRVYAYPLIRCAWRKSIYIFSLFFISFHERFDHWIPFTSLQSQSSSNWL